MQLLFCPCTMYSCHYVHAVATHHCISTTGRTRVHTSRGWCTGNLLNNILYGNCNCFGCMHGRDRKCMITGLQHCSPLVLSGRCGRTVLCTMPPSPAHAEGSLRHWGAGTQSKAELAGVMFHGGCLEIPPLSAVCLGKLTGKMGLTSYLCQNCHLAASRRLSPAWLAPTSAAPAVDLDRQIAPLVSRSSAVWLSVVMGVACQLHSTVRCDSPILLALTAALENPWKLTSCQFCLLDASHCLSSWET